MTNQREPEPSLPKAALPPLFPSPVERPSSMTRTFTRYAVSAVLVAAAVIALWGIRNAIYAQQEEAATASPATGDADKARQLGLAMLNYAEAHGRFPPATRYGSDGAPLLSWRVLILPYLGEHEKKLYSQFHLDEPWDSPANKPLSELIPSVFAPGDADPFSSPDTFWQVFDGGTTIFANSQGMPFSDIHDGLSNTILLVESNTTVPWTKPVDLSFDALSPTTHQGLDVQRGFRVVMADGTVRKVPPSFPVDKLKEFITRKGNEHSLDTSVLTQFDVWVPERHENNPNVRQQPSPNEFNQSFRKGGAAGPSLEQQVRQEFDARQASLRQQIKDFSERLQRLTVLVDERDRAKEAIIQRRIDELRNPNLRWEAADQAASGSNRSQQPLATDRPADVAKPKVAVETFPLRHIKPDRVVKVLIEDFHGSAGIQLSQTSDSIKVAGVPADLERIRALVKNLDVAPPAGDEASAAVAELDGLWEAILPPDLADTVPVEKRLRLVFYKNMHATFIGKTLQTACTFSVTPSASPKCIALHGDQPKRGLYEVSGDGLRLSIAPADAAFPTRFGTEKAEFKRINNAVPQEMLDAITSHLQDTTWSKRAGNRLSEPEGDPIGGKDVKAVERQTAVFSLLHAKAETLQKTIAALFENTKSEIQLSHEPSTNSLLVSASPDDMMKVEALLRRLDVLPPPVDEASGATTELEGVWEVSYLDEKAGVPPIEKRSHIAFHHNLYANFNDNVIHNAGIFSTDTSASPKRIDFRGDKPQQGLYAMNGDSLWFALNSHPASYPTQLTKGNFVYKRIAKTVPQEMLDAIKKHLQVTIPTDGAGSPFSADRDATSNKTDPSGVLLLRSANDFQADLAWARSNANKAEKARDKWIAEAKKTSPDATERDIDPALLDQWQTAKERLDFLRNEFASQMKLIDSALETCRQEIATEKERLSEMDRTVVPGGRIQSQQKVIAKMEHRLKQILTLRDLYEKVNEFPSTTVVPNDVKLPGAVEMENDLRQQIGLDLSTGTIKASQGEEERKVLVVAAVRADSPAAKAGLQEMDLIVAAHIWQIASPENLWYALSQVGSTRTDKSLEEIKVWVRRNGQDVSVRLPPIEHKW